ncbi:hypothetical protein DFQ28_003471 [Apophysomyces sp. BC1034]|nr:hypothetical protein DFQ30_003330 [Apophysomyces sp. BC1015]KAG0173989.1 hypothetical protein DFQ29_007656 [Apophysomyces sp. BC1021]KAG0189389.1 hypothetical protein DFQ28_003471 [Apophysomyces sp. BC1034]
MTVALALLSRASEEATASCPEPPYIFGLLLTNTYTKVNVPTPVIKQYGSAGDAPNYFDRAAQLGYVPAQTRMAYISENGLYGAPINLSKSFVYYAAAASQGDAHAMLGLSRLYNRGSRGPGDNNEEQLMAIDVSGWLASTVPNEDEAFQWCQRAAEKGIADALFLLGWYYEAGIGVLRNDEQANYYYGAAADKGHAVAVERMQRLNVTSRYRREEIPRTRRGKKKQKRRWRCLVM